MLQVPPALTQRQIFTIIGGLLAGMALASLDQTIVSTSLPTIVGELGGLEDISWVVTAYLLMETVSTPIYGKLSDIYGRPALFRFAIVVFVAGSMLCGVAQDLWMLVLFRAIQGIGAGGLISMAFAAMGDIIPPRDRGRYTGFFSSVFAVTSVVGPLLGGFLTDHVSWRWIFYVNVPVGILALAVTSRALRLLPPPARERRQPLDVMGALLLVAGVSSILLALEWGGTDHPWTSPMILGLGVGGLGVLVLWVAWERRAVDPIVPLRLFRNDVVAVAGGMAFLTGVAMFGSVTYLPLFLQVVKGVSASNSGLLLVPLMGGVVVAATLGGRRIARTGRYAFSGPMGFGLITAGMAGLAAMGEATPLVTVFGIMVLLGVGVGVLSPPLTIAVQNVVDPSDMGVATATNMFMRTMGASIGVAVFGALFSSGIPGDGVRDLLRQPGAIDALPADVAATTREAVASALQPVFIAGTVIAAVGVLLATRLREVPLRASVPPRLGPEEEIVEATVT
jgi:EmrB/QacA subfamily drug resistance transporter